MQNHDIHVLNRLIETTLDSADGYAEAARDARSGRFARTFQERAGERHQLASRLQQQVRALGGEPEDDGSVLAAAHRMFLHLRDLLGKGGDKAVLDEVERGEDHIKAKFEEAMKDNGITPATQAVITQAYASVKAGHDQMSQFKHAMERPR
jgi:uncharacterized protein (TIGR02284 family)